MAKSRSSGPILDPQFFFSLVLPPLVSIVPCYHPIQFKRKLRRQTQGNSKELNLGLFGPNLSPKKLFLGFYLYQQLNIVPSYYSIEFIGKLTNQSSENGKKPNSGPDFDLFGPKSGPNFFVWFTSASCQTLLQPIIACNFQEN